MEKFTNKQLDLIEKRASKMTESQKDIFAKRLQEAGFIDKILGAFGSPSKNLQKLVKQRDDSVKQIDAMINAINSANVNGITPEMKQTDVKALTDLKTKLLNVNLNIQIDETPVADGNNNQAQGADNSGNQAQANNQ